MHQEITQSSLSEFSKQVYLTLLNIPKGKVTTYKAVADAVGTTAYRQIGQIIGKNPWIPQVPCHRVVSSTGKLQGYAHGLEKKRELLESEGISVVNDTVDETKILRKL